MESFYIYFNFIKQFKIKKLPKIKLAIYTSSLDIFKYVFNNKVCEVDETDIEDLLLEAVYINEDITIYILTVVYDEDFNMSFTIMLYEMACRQNSEKLIKIMIERNNDYISSLLNIEHLKIICENKNLKLTEYFLREVERNNMNIDLYKLILDICKQENTEIIEYLIDYIKSKEMKLTNKNYDKMIKHIKKYNSKSLKYMEKIKPKNYEIS